MQKELNLRKKAVTDQDVTEAMLRDSTVLNQSVLNTLK